MRVLLVEDDDLIAHGILAGLRACGLTVDGVATAAQAEATLSAVHCDVVILDLGLPDEDGMSLLHRCVTPRQKTASGWNCAPRKTQSFSACATASCNSVPRIWRGLRIASGGVAQAKAADWGYSSLPPSPSVSVDLSN